MVGLKLSLVFVLSSVAICSVQAESGTTMVGVVRQ
jgi:hypothetical protein